MYWMNQILSVYIILHDRKKNLTLWQKVSDHLLTYHDYGKWSIEIPPEQVLDEAVAKFM